MNQLVDMQRGDLDFTDPDDPVIDGKEFAQNWTLDATGNWSEFQEDSDGDGTPELDQDRTHDAANELTAADGWATPDYDQAGNMIFAPQPNTLAVGYNLKYDAWNRMVRVSKMVGETEQTVAEYRYDGDNRRILKTTFADGEPGRNPPFLLQRELAGVGGAARRP